MSLVTVDFTDHVARVTLNRPDKMNAVSMELIDDLIAAGEEVAASSARAVVLQGKGRAFCAGLDVASFAMLAKGNAEDLIAPRTHGDANKFQQVALIWRDVQVPVIAALHGVVFGAGLQIALGADIRIAAPDTQFAVMEMKWGLVPDMGGMVLLPRLVRSDVLRYLTYTARPVPADRALDWGLVTEIADDPQAAAWVLAAEIAEKSPSAMREAKALIAEAEGRATADLLMEESRAQIRLVGQKDQREVIAAQMEGRAPKFD